MSEYILVKQKLPHWHVNLSGFSIFKANEWIEVEHKFNQELDRNGFLYHWTETAKHSSVEYQITREEFDSVFKVIEISKDQYDFLEGNFGLSYGNTIIGAILDDIDYNEREDDE